MSNDTNVTDLNEQNEQDEQDTAIEALLEDLGAEPNTPEGQDDQDSDEPEAGDPCNEPAGCGGGVACA